MDTNTPGGSYSPPPGGDYTTPPPPAGGGGGGSALIMPSTPPKDPIITLVLSLLIVCVGYFYIGQWQKGVAAIVAALVIGIPTCGLGVGAVAIFAGIDGFMQAQQLQQGF